MGPFLFGPSKQIRVSTSKHNYGFYYRNPTYHVFVHFSRDRDVLRRLRGVNQHVCMVREMVCNFPKGPSTQYSRTFVPKTINGMVFGTRNLIYWVLGPSGFVRQWRILKMSWRGVESLGVGWKMGLFKGPLGRLYMDTGYMGHYLRYLKVEGT